MWRRIYVVRSVSRTQPLSLHGTDGNKALGFTLMCDDEKQTVSMSAPDSLEQVCKSTCRPDGGPEFCPF